MEKKGEVIVVEVEKTPVDSGVPEVAKRLDERRKSISAEGVEESQIASKMTAAEERREQALKDRVEKAAEHVKSCEERKENLKTHKEERRLSISKSLKEKQDHAEKKAKEALAAKQAGLSEYMKVLNLSSRANPEDK